EEPAQGVSQLLLPLPDRVRVARHVADADLDQRQRPSRHLRAARAAGVAALLAPARSLQVVMARSAVEQGKIEGPAFRFPRLRSLSRLTPDQAERLAKGHHPADENQFRALQPIRVVAKEFLNVGR